MGDGMTLPRNVSSVHLIALLSGLATITIGCGSEAAGPGDGSSGFPRGPQVSVRDTISGQLPEGTDLATYHFVAGGSSDAAVFFVPVGGLIDLIVTDQRTGDTLANRRSYYPGDTISLRQWRTNRFPIAAQQAYVISLHRANPHDDIHFRFVVEPVDPAPESRDAAFAIGDTVTEESLENTADIDEFEFEGAAGTELIAYFEPLGSFSPGMIEVDVFDPTDSSSLAFTAHYDVPVGLEQRHSRRFLLPHSGSFTVRVRGAPAIPRSGFTEGGPYRFELFAIDRAPETGSASVSPGDTVSQTIERVGDVDEFTFVGHEGSELNLFLEAHNDLTWGARQLQVTLLSPNPADTFALSMIDGGDEAALRDNASGRFTLPADGTYRIVADGMNDYGWFRGAYRFFLYPIDRAPESTPATLLLGDSVTGEAIDLAGDIDEYAIPLSDPTIVNVVIQADDPLEYNSETTLHVLDVTADTVVGSTRLSPFDSDCGGTGLLRLEPGSYMVRAQASNTTGAGYDGTYRLWAHAIDEAPEHVSANVSEGVSVTGEDLRPLGDVDVFRLTGQTQQLLDVVVEADGDPFLTYVRSALTGDTIAAVSPAGPRLVVPTAGDYEIVVATPYLGRSCGWDTDYRIELRPVDTAPETEPPIVVAGDSINQEAIDFVGDVDEFVVTGVPADYMQHFLEATALSGCCVQLDVLHPTTNELLASAAAGIYGRSFDVTGRVQIPPEGQLRLRVHETWVGPITTGGYTVLPFRIDPSPEVLDSRVILDSLIEGEAIDPLGDIDEFLFAGTAGQRIEVFMQQQTWEWMSSEFVLEVVDPVSGDVLGSETTGNTYHFDMIHPDHSTGPITLPSTGDYIIRMRGETDVTGASWDVGPYHFLVAAAP